MLVVLTPTSRTSVRGQKWLGSQDFQVFKQFSWVVITRAVTVISSHNTRRSHSWFSHKNSTGTKSKSNSNLDASFIFQCSIFWPITHTWKSGVQFLHFLIWIKMRLNPDDTSHKIVNRLTTVSSSPLSLLIWKIVCCVKENRKCFQSILLLQQHI